MALILVLRKPWRNYVIKFPVTQTIKRPIKRPVRWPDNAAALLTPTSQGMIAADGKTLYARSTL